jgi:hypothetical protein
MWNSYEHQNQNHANNKILQDTCGMTVINIRYQGIAIFMRMIKKC